MRNTTFSKTIKALGLFLIIGITLFPNLSFANSTTSYQKSIFNELAYQEILEVTLAMNHQAVFGNKRNTDKHPAVFSYADRDGNMQTWNIKVALRGKFRRTRCENLAPLKLNFKKSDLKAAGLAKFDDMKLVTHCVENGKEAKQLLQREYIAYKLYNQITENSFRVQFLKIKYVDTVTGDSEIQYGILIEDTAELRARINATKVDSVYNIPQDEFNAGQVSRVAMFQYLIGNADWDISRTHNIKVVRKEGKLILVPYDFDFSGLVDAPYATLSAELELSSPQERIYLGFEQHKSLLQTDLNFYLVQKENLVSVIKDCEMLNQRNKKQMVRYLDSFYGNLDTINFRKSKKTAATLGE